MKTVLFIITIIGLAAVAGAIFVGVRSFDGTVTEKPYETGLAWDSIRKEKKETGWNVTVGNDTFRTGDMTLTLSVTERQKALLRDAEVAVLVSRPNTADFDRTYNAVPDKQGLYSAGVHFPAYGYWDLKITVLKDKKRVSFDKRILIEKGEETR